MNAYSIGADSQRWWWLPATAGALGATAIAAILVLPADGDVSPERVAPDRVPPPAGGTRFSTIDPALDPQCFRLLPRTLGDLDQPRCGRESRRGQWSSIIVPRPGLDARP
jgi:hypothetical protein